MNQVWQQLVQCSGTGRVMLVVFNSRIRTRIVLGGLVDEKDGNVDRLSGESGRARLMFPGLMFPDGDGGQNAGSP